MRSNSLFVVIPAYNEEKKIADVISDVKNKTPQAAIIVVDDGSTDKTSENAGAANVVVLRHIVNRGQGAALWTGTLFALKSGADYIVHFDADSQFDAKDIMPAIAELKLKDTDIVFGSRFLRKGDAKGIPFVKRYFILPVGRIVNFIFTGLFLNDAHNGFRAMTRKATENLVITMDRMAHNSEILAQVASKKLKWAEVPTSVRYFEYGQGMRGGLGIVKDFILGKFFKS